MVNHMIVAWAIPVDVADLGPQLEAYVKTKNIICVLEYCARHAQPGSALARLPSELIESIANHNGQPSYRDLDRWRQMVRCCAGDCDPAFHLYFDDRPHRFSHHDDEKHDVRVRKLLEATGQDPSGKRDARFSECRKVSDS